MVSKCFKDAQKGLGEGRVMFNLIWGGHGRSPYFQNYQLLASTLLSHFVFLCASLITLISAVFPTL